jgi:hypothetical protein
MRGKMVVITRSQLQHILAASQAKVVAETKVLAAPTKPRSQLQQILAAAEAKAAADPHPDFLCPLELDVMDGKAHLILWLHNLMHSSPDPVFDAAGYPPPPPRPRPALIICCKMSPLVGSKVHQFTLCRYDRKAIERWFRTCCSQVCRPPRKRSRVPSLTLSRPGCSFDVAKFWCGTSK